MNRYTIKFQYADEMSRGEWRNQSCSLVARDERSAINECIKLYGLGVDCIYRIISVEIEK